MTDPGDTLSQAIVSRHPELAGKVHYVNGRPWCNGVNHTLMCDARFEAPAAEAAPCTLDQARAAIADTDQQVRNLVAGAYERGEFGAGLADQLAHGLGVLTGTANDALNRAAAAERERLSAVISPDLFRKLADWFDADDEFKMTMFPETWSPGSRPDEVQRDLRKFADLLEGGTDA